MSCPLVVRGLWREMLDLMHDGDPYGHLTAGGVPITDSELARLVGEPLSIVRRYLQELEDKKVFSRTSDGVIFSRRMVRDEAIRRARADGGKDSLKNPNVPRPKASEEDRPPPSKRRKGTTKGPPEGYPSADPPEDPSGGPLHLHLLAPLSASAKSDLGDRTDSRATAAPREPDSVALKGPSEQEVQRFFASRNRIPEDSVAVEAAEFVEFYRERDWQVHGQPIRDWTAFARKWESTYVQREAEPEPELEAVPEVVTVTGVICPL